MFGSRVRHAIELVALTPRRLSAAVWLALAAVEISATVFVVTESIAAYVVMIAFSGLAGLGASIEGFQPRPPTALEKRRKAWERLHPGWVPWLSSRPRPQGVITCGSIRAEAITCEVIRAEAITGWPVPRRA